MAGIPALLIFGLAVATALPTNDPIIRKLNPEEPRYQYLQAEDGTPHLVDQWLSLSMMERISSYQPRSSNVYHLLTRTNPWVTQLLVNGDTTRLLNSNFDPTKRTAVLIHGFLGSLTTNFNQVMVPAYLAAADMNVIVLDWSAGSYWGPNAGPAAVAAAQFIDWINEVTGAKPESYHITGFSVGGHAAGILGRSITGDVAYVTACDPSERWDADTYFRADDGIYTEVIHSSSLGVRDNLGQGNMFPNGGSGQPGCLTPLCDHDRSFEYLAESLISGGFTARQCATLAEALNGRCTGLSVRLGGLDIKYGVSGLYGLTTNRRSPYSQG